MPTFKTSDGLTLYYEDEGQGAPLLCLSGLTRNARDFDHVMPHLSGRRVIRLDYRGRGQSDWSEDYSSYNIPREAQDAIELLDHLGLDKVALLGTSRGGLIAMVLAATAKDRLAAVALNDIGPELSPAGLEVILGYLGIQPDVLSLEDLAQARKTAMESQFPGVPLERWMQEVSGCYIETPDGVELGYDPKLRDAVIEAGATGPVDLWPLFDAIAPLPAAVIHGENSDLLSHETVAEMQRRMPGLIVAHVADRAHIPFLDEPESLSALHKWLEQTP